MLISIIKKSQSYFIFSFLLAIAGGSALLRLPFIRQDGIKLEWIDALFTATSAICVTGLTTVPIDQFSLAGQILVMLLIQAGGVGIMTLSASIMMFLGRSMSWSDTMMLSNMNDFSRRGIEKLIRMVVIYTLYTELAGLLLLLGGFYLGEGYSFADSMYYATFHAISAFCNAGMSIFPDNIFGQSSYIKLVVAWLVIMGGLGVYVIYDCINCLQYRQQLKANSKLIVLTTLILLVGGTGLIKFFEYVHHNPISWLDSFFMAVSARTAGFNSVQMSNLSSSTITAVILLMMVGGSPGSTAGGMKTTAVALAFIAMYNTFQGNQRVLLFRREIPIANVLKAFTIVVTFVLLAAAGSAAFTSLDPGPLQSSIFEVASALGTVGLSLGATATATPAAKALLIFYMFLGRVGPFTMFLFLLGRERVSRLSYPEEHIIIG